MYITHAHASMIFGKIYINYRVTLIVLLHKFFTILFRSCILLHLFTYLKVGVGMSMEGIEQNPVVYDLMSEMAFQHNKVDVEVMLRFVSI